MIFALCSVLTVATLRHAQSPFVVDYLDKMDSQCTAEACTKQLTPCADGTDQDCMRRIECLTSAKSEDVFSGCLIDKDKQKMTWTELDDTEVKVLDCAHTAKCMPDEWDAKTSFLEMLAVEKSRRGLDAKVPESFLELGEDAAAAAAATGAAYLDKAEQLVQKTQQMIEMVLLNPKIGLSEKMETLRRLTGHLNSLQDGARKTMQSMGFDTGEIEKEVESEFADEPEALRRWRASQTSGASSDAAADAAGNGTTADHLRSS